MNTFLRITIAATLLGGALAAQATGQLVLTPAVTTVSPGDGFALQVRGIGFADRVVGGGFNLSFDPGVLTLASVSVDTGVWEFASSAGQIDNLAGTLGDVYFNSFKAQLPTGDFNVATLQFTAKSVGATSVQMSDSASFPFADDLANVIAVAYLPGNVTVSAVPEPASLALLTLGLLAGGLRARFSGSASRGAPSR